MKHLLWRKSFEILNLPLSVSKPVLLYLEYCLILFCIAENISESNQGLALAFTLNLFHRCDCCHEYGAYIQVYLYRHWYIQVPWKIDFLKCFFKFFMVYCFIDRTSISLRLWDLQGPEKHTEIKLVISQGRIQTFRGSKTLTVFLKRVILDVLPGSDYTSIYHSKQYLYIILYLIFLFSLFPCYTPKHHLIVWNHSEV